ncbi:MAG TPA: hypothetical protein VFF70_06135 [Anaerolineae bacterium]|nr:hypothetical protein [Anaerolineae bacterium]
MSYLQTLMLIQSQDKCHTNKDDREQFWLILPVWQLREFQIKTAIVSIAIQPTAIKANIAN